MLNSSDTAAEVLSDPREISAPDCNSTKGTAIIAWSLANLLFAPQWQEVRTAADIRGSYFDLASPSLTLLGATLCNVLVLTGLFFASAVLVRRWPHPFVWRFGAATFLGLLLAVMIPVLPWLSSLSSRTFWQVWTNFPSSALPQRLLGLFALTASFIPHMLILAGITFAILRTRRAVAVAKISVAILSPFGFIVAADCAWSHTRRSDPALHHAPQPAAAVPANRSPRIVWIIFDEMDAGALKRMSLPNFEALRRISLEATAVQPAGAVTLEAMPALISGKPVEKAEAYGRELLLKLRDQPTLQSWASIPNIFQKLRQSGYNTGVVGWYHPYCRLFGADITKCFGYECSAVSMEALWRNYAGEQGLARTMAIQWMRISPWLFKAKRDDGEEFPLVSAWEWEFFRRSVQNVYSGTRKDALQLSCDKTIGFALLHLPVPHPPAIYDPRKGVVRSDPNLTYRDNLLLADRTLGEIRSAMTGAGVWDDSVVLVSSDHPLRASWSDLAVWHKSDDFFTNGSRVPFLLKLPRQIKGMLYEKSLNAIVTNSLLLGIAQGRLSALTQVLQHLDQFSLQEARNETT